MPRSRPTTPVRRVSRGSISSHHRASTSGNHVLGASSTGNPNSGGQNGGNQQLTNTPLSFLTQAMADLSYETATLQSNLESIDEIQSALHTFDEGFATFLYGLKMNAFCVEWPEAPGEENFERAEERKVAAAHAFGSDVNRIGQRLSFAGGITMNTEDASSFVYDTTAMPADQTYMTQDDDAELMNRKPIVSSAQQKPPIKPALKSAMKKPSTVSSAGTTGRSTGRSIQQPQQRQQQQQTKSTATTTTAPVKAKITAAEKKRREGAAEEIIETLPLDYRGGDPSAKQLAMRVILALIASGQKGIRINEIVKSPELPQAKVNKCLIALVGAKQVIRRSDNGVVYHLDPEKNPIAAV